MRRAFFLSVAVGTSACGVGQSAQASNDAPLTNTPISFAAATGQISERAGVALCPFVSDETIVASVRSSFALTRRTASNSSCFWSYNAGFSVKVTIEDATIAKPIEERRYNIGIDPQLARQSGPGTKATVLSDTAFGRPLPYAFSFEKDGKLVFIRYTGLKTNIEIMRPVANEIARRMGSELGSEPQRSQPVADFIPCEVWTSQDLKTVFGIGGQSRVDTGRRGSSTCSWDIFEDGAAGRRTAAFNIYKPEPGKKQEYEYSSYSPYQSDGETHYIRASHSDFGLYIHIVTPRPEGIVHTTVSDAHGDPTSVAKRLHSNLLSRLEP